MIYIDVDGTVRDMEMAIFGKRIQNWSETVNGMDLSDYVSAHPEEILVASKPTQYYTTILDIIGEENTFHFLTKQKKEWEPFTEQWLDLHFKKYDVKYVDQIEDKMTVLKPGDILIDDYPYFSCYDQVILLDYAYNKHTDCKWRVKSPEELKSLMKKL